MPLLMQLIQRALLCVLLNALLCGIIATAADFGERRERAFVRKLSPPGEYPRLADVGGLQRAKELVLTRMIVPLRLPRLFAGRYRVRGLPRLRGALFSGAPGTGKTMLARAIANEARVPLLQVRLADIESKFYGEASKNLRAVFAAARRAAPAVIFFDEIDGIIRRRSEGESSATYGIKTELLQHLDAIADCAVLVVACTNSSETLDPAVARRLPHHVRMELPSLDERVAIMQRTLAHEGEEALSAPELMRVLRHTEGCSGSDLVQLLQVALCCRYRRVVATGRGNLAQRLRSLGPITEADWSEAVRDVGV